MSTGRRSSRPRSSHRCTSCAHAAVLASRPTRTGSANRNPCRSKRREAHTYMIAPRPRAQNIQGRSENMHIPLGPWNRSRWKYVSNIYCELWNRFIIFLLWSGSSFYCILFASERGWKRALIVYTDCSQAQWRSLQVYIAGAQRFFEPLELDEYTKRFSCRPEPRQNAKRLAPTIKSDIKIVMYKLGIVM